METSQPRVFLFSKEYTIQEKWKDTAGVCACMHEICVLWADKAMVETSCADRRRRREQLRIPQISWTVSNSKPTQGVHLICCDLLKRNTTQRFQPWKLWALLGPTGAGLAGGAGCPLKSAMHVLAISCSYLLGQCFPFCSRISDLHTLSVLSLTTRLWKGCEWRAPGIGCCRTRTLLQ